MPVQPDQLQQALHEAGRLPQRHAKEYLHCQARLERGITENRRPASLSRRWRLPNHIGIKPHCQRTAPPQCLIVSRPIRGLILRGGPTVHASQQSCWIHAVNPSTDFCNKALDKRHRIHSRHQWIEVESSQLHLLFL